MADGIYIEAHIDAHNIGKELEKELARIEKISRDIEIHANLSADLTDQIDKRADTILAIEKAGGAGSRIYKEIVTEQEKAIAKQESIEAKITDMETKLRLAKDHAAELKEQLGETAPQTEKASNALQKFGKRLTNLARRVFVFSLITSALRSMRDYLGEAIKKNAEASQSFAKLKGAVQTAAQPILNVLIPALTWLANVLRVVIMDIAKFFAMLTGKSVSDFATDAQSIADSMGETASGAKKAKKALAGFDEINTLSFGGGGGGGGSSSVPDFGGLDETTDKLKIIAKIVEAIGLAFASWKLASFITNLAGINATFTNILGIALAIAGAFVTIQGVADAWVNGISWKNYARIVEGIALTVAGLALAFGTTEAAIGAIVGFVALLAVGIKDVAKNGWNAKNLTAIETAIIGIGVAISLITGGWIPLLIAGIVGVVTLIVAKWDSIKEMFGKAGDFFKGVWDKVKTYASNAWEGVKNVWKSLGTFFGDIFSKAWDKVKAVFSKGGTVFNGVTEGIANAFKKILNSLISGINKVIAVPFNAINAALRTIRDISILGIQPFKNVIHTINVPSIPYLAQGTVVPPNREFLAMLGDNKTETEVVSPLSTMKQALIEALAEAGQNQTIVVNVDGQKLFDIIVNRNNNTVRRTGATPLLV